MKGFIRIISMLMVLSLSFVVLTAQEDSTMTTDGHVFEIAVREIVDMEGFEALSGELQALLQEQAGYIGNLQYTTFFSLAPEMAEGQVYAVGITEWESIEAYEASQTLMDNQTVVDYLATIETVQNVVVEPFVIGEQITLDDFPQVGEVFEVAIRDLSSYENPIHFLRTVRGFTDVLGEEEGVLREYEWLSVDGQYFVGMTRYADMEAFGSASQSETVFGSPATSLLFAQYPPIVAQITTRNE